MRGQIRDHLSDNIDLLSRKVAVRMYGRQLKAARKVITQVWERLYIGGLKDAERLNADNPASITTVVSLCPEEVLPKATGIKYVRVPIPDAQPISAVQLEEITKTLAEPIRRGAVLLICAAGMSRSPTMAAAWRHRNGNLDVDAAMRYIAVLRPTIVPSPILLGSVRGEPQAPMGASYGRNIHVGGTSEELDRRRDNHLHGLLAVRRCAVFNDPRCSCLPKTGTASRIFNSKRSGAEVV